jgi:uncharacterized protein involved in exopolysaccharide biosynthesis
LNSHSESASVAGLPAPPGHAGGDARAPADVEEIDLRQVIVILWGYRLFIAACVLLTTTIALVYVLTATPYYIADALVSPVDNTGGAKGGGLAALGSLAGLAGISISGDSNRDVSLATLDSRLLIEQMIRDKNLLPILFKDRWDAEKQAWKDPDPKRAPTLLDGYLMFDGGVLTIGDEKKKGLITVTVEWTSPTLAAEWANEIVQRANDALRTEALEESEHNLAYLREQATQTSFVDMRQAIYSLMESELKNSMLARGNDQYAFKIVDPAVVPERKSRPRRLKTLFQGFVMGWLLGIAVSLVRWRIATI